MDVTTAIETARELLVGLPQRLAHALACGEVAERVTRQILEVDGDRVVSAAYLHDIGYAERLVATGLHSLDGAAWLTGFGEPDLASLVAHHSGAECEAHERGLGAAIAAYAKPRQIEADILAYCDLSSGPSGEAMTFDERICDIRRRYPEGHPVRLAVSQALPQLRGSVRRVELLIAGPVPSGDERFRSLRQECANSHSDSLVDGDLI